MKSIFSGMNLFAFTYGLLALVSMAKAANYCSPNLCPNGVKHIACRNNGKFASTCPSNAQMVNLSGNVRAILNLHNKYRNQIAGGNFKRYKQAQRMATMSWNKELASIAAYNVKQCQMRHDKCRNTATFLKSGQNLAFMRYSGARNRMTNARLIRDLINLWFREHKNANMSYINRYPNNYSGPDIGHFTTMVADRNIRVGCAASRYTRNNYHNFLLCCNYATTNIIGQQVYASGAAGSGCKKGRNKTYRNLCAPAEVYSGL